jgi:hypothetical protein
MERKPGTRVGALLSMRELDGGTVIEVLGYGEYVGDEIPDEEARGLAEKARQAGEPNPKIVLDNGDVVWGGECWWGPERKFRAMLKRYRKAGYVLQDVRIGDMRHELEGDRIKSLPEIERQAIGRQQQPKQPPPEPVECPQCGWKGMSNEMVVSQRELEAALQAVQEGLRYSDVRVRCPKCRYASPRSANQKSQMEA